VNLHRRRRRAVKSVRPLSLSVRSSDASCSTIYSAHKRTRIKKNYQMAPFLQKPSSSLERGKHLFLLFLSTRARTSNASSNTTTFRAAFSSSLFSTAATEKAREEGGGGEKEDVFHLLAGKLPQPMYRATVVNDDGTTTPISDVRSAVQWAKEAMGGKKKFDQTVEMSIRLGVNPKRSDMIVRGTCNLPNGTGKKFYVLAFAENEEDREMARQAGADAVGGEELIEQIKSGKFEDLNKVNVCVATPGIVPKLKSSGLARTLGPKGLMPNPKVGTLTAEVGKAVRDAKSGGRVEYRAEKNSIVHAGIGKTSFEEDAIVENASCLMASVLQNRPKGKGAPAISNYIKRVYLSTTMSEGSRRIDPKELMKLAEEYNQRNTSMSSSPGA
jgi:large subunit ribosomal protein L1